jgi:hypothetical protein
MAGQGRNADGLIGSHPRNAVNVVRFPGDWFGPLSDLVTVGSDAEDAREYHDRFAREPADNAAGVFWGEDAADDRRSGEVTEGVPSSDAVAPTPRRSLRRDWFSWRRAVPSGCAAIAVVAVVVALASGANATQSAHTLVRPTARHLTVKPAVVPEVKIWLGRTSSTGLGLRHRDKALNDRRASRPSRRLSPVPSAAQRQTRTVVGAANPQLMATATTGNIDSPTGVVSPPPSATQANP